MNRFGARLLWSALLLAGRAAPGGDVRDAQNALAELKRQAVSNHPEVLAAEQFWLAARRRRASLEGFFDPAAVVSAGAADRSPALPALSRSFGWVGDAFWLEGGVEMALRPGVFIGAGAAGRYRNDADENDPGEALFGAQVRVPLRRDRSFRLWKSERNAADAETEEAAGRWLAARQNVLRDVELRYIEYQLALAQREVAAAARERAERLLSDAEAMARIGLLPAHQLNAARLEAARRREEEIGAARAMDAARRQLLDAAGGGALPASAEAAIPLLDWARSAIAEERTPRPAPDQRGDIRAAAAALLGEEHRRRRAEEERRAEVFFHAAAGWRTDADPDEKASDGAQWAVGLSWRASLGNRAAAGRADEARARREARSEELRNLEQRAELEWEIAQLEFAAAGQRLALMEEAVETARGALAAETERFRLGEGASRAVLDAQKDLNDAVRRRNEIASEVLRARARRDYAASAAAESDPAPSTAPISQEKE